MPYEKDFLNAPFKENTADSFMDDYLDMDDYTDNRINFIKVGNIARERGVIFSHSYSNDKIPYTNKIKTIVYSNNKQRTMFSFKSECIYIIYNASHCKYCIK